MIALESATVRFGDRTVLRELSFRVEAGRSLAILGPNGCGKTTALRAALGFQRLASGRRVAPRIVGYVPQSVAIAHPYRVLEVVAMGRAARLGLFGQPGREDRTAAAAALERLGLSQLAEAMFDRLSGGERQLVLLARALATGSPALVLDEPGAALDLANQARLLALLDGLRQERRYAILFTTHDPNQVLAAADEALLLMPGGGARQGASADLIAPEPLGALYGVPMRMVGLTGTDGRMRRAVLPAFAGEAA
ncbi:MAG: ABC transporter ATP-binding protein [Acetobacteraceae bacterium]|nr:ABC transporter ATP-binding protein [Acetobacteraceae bacterium]MDW8398800.1 ABC transporter ATP-binding protein [Acetobacteraceae bacterium]